MTDRFEAKMWLAFEVTLHRTILMAERIEAYSGKDMSAWIGLVQDDEGKKALSKARREIAAALMPLTDDMDDDAVKAKLDVAFKETGARSNAFSAAEKAVREAEATVNWWFRKGGEG